MNIIPIICKRCTVFFGLLVFNLSLCYAQKPYVQNAPGTPLILKYYFPSNYFASGKISVYEDPSGVFLMGSNNKIIVFYGNEFKAIPLKGQINISANLKSIFYTGYNSLGLIKLFKNNDPKLIPLINEMIINQHRFGQINDVFIINDLILFNNDRKLYQFDGNDFLAIDSSIINLQLFKIHDTVYVQKYENGLQKFFMGTLTPLTNGNKLAGKRIDCMLPYQDGFLLKFKNDANFIFFSHSGELKKLNFGFEDYLSKAGFADALMLPGNRLAIATKSAGILIYNLDYDYIQKIGKNEGLVNNIANSLHIDKAGNLWVLHNIGLSRIELNFPVTQYSGYAGILGDIFDIAKYKDNLYLATSNGLLKGSLGNISGTSKFSSLFFNKVDGIINECYKIYEINNGFHAVTATGIYSLNDKGSELIYSDEINAFDRIAGSNHVCYGKGNELIVLEFSGKSYHLINKIQINNYILSEIVCENENTFWARTSNNFLIQVNYNTQLNRLSYTQITKKYSTLSEEPAFNIFKAKNGIRFCYADSVLYFDKKSNRLLPEINNYLDRFSGISIHAEIPNQNNSLFHVSNPSENLQGILMYNQASTDDSVRSYFFHTGLWNSPVLNDSNNIWIGGENKLLRIENTKIYKAASRHTAIVKKVIVGKDSILEVGLDDPEISNSYNTIKFMLSSTSFEGEPYNKYQYYLEGYNTEWSTWQKMPEVTFFKLPQGSYNFKLRTLNINGTISDVTEFRFVILPPFYLTIPAYAFYLVFLLFVIFIALRYRTWRFMKYKEFMERVVQERTEDIMREKEKSEILIANLLPKNTADELKLTGKASSQKFSLVTVLFSDIEGFTKIAEQMNPELLIDELDAFFFHFDMVVEKYNIEKIKTIGDAYMCAGGIPDKNITNPVEVVLAALEMQEYMKELKSKNSNIWDLRIGIHTGSVIAGVVGHKKMSYDIWGDTVNTASRMESSGEPGKVNISGQTFELIKDFFICEHRGRMPVKYKGEIDMYFVKCIRPELAIDMKNIPNRRFMVLLQLLRLQDVEDVVLEKLKDLPGNLYFHNIARTREIYSLVDLFGRAEELTDEENLILRTAALFQEMGYLHTYDNYEDESMKFAREILPDFKYTPEQINAILDLIEVSKRLRKPNNKVEEILLDANMNYLSRADFISLNDALFFELLEKDKVSDKEDWNKMQIVLLSNHKYYTRVANMLRDVNPEQQIENLIRSSQKSDPS